MKVDAVRSARDDAPHIQRDTARFESPFQIRDQLVLIARVASFNFDFRRPFLPELGKIFEEVTKSPILPIISEHIRVFDSKESVELSTTKREVAWQIASFPRAVFAEG